MIEIRYIVFYILGAILWGGLILPPVQLVFHDGGIRWLQILLFSFFLSFLLTPIVKKIAVRWTILDHPCARKVHKNPTPLLGGVAIYVAFTTSLLANNILAEDVTAILIAATGIMLVSLLDDIKPLSAELKFLVQLLAAAVVFSSGIQIVLFPDHGIGAAANVILTFLWIVGITNAMNFIDGTDGLATGLGIVISVFLGIVAFQTNQVFLGWFAVAMTGSCLGFLPYNFRHMKPAGIFLGDTGSTFIGFTLACLGVKGEWASNAHVVSICAPIMIFGVLIFDMTHTTVARIASGKVRSFHDWVAYVGKDHIHHRMYRLFQSNKKAVGLILAMSCCLGMSAVVMRDARESNSLLIVLQGIIAFLIFSVMDYQQEKTRSRIESRRTWSRIQELFSASITIPQADMSLEGSMIDISMDGARVITQPASQPIATGASILLSLIGFSGPDAPILKGQVVRTRPVLLIEDKGRYLELGIQFSDFQGEQILAVVERVCHREIEKIRADITRQITPLPDAEAG